MTNNTQYIFKPKPEVADWIDEHIPSWTSYCYENIYKTQKKNYYEKFNDLSNRLGLILIGCIIISTLYIIPINSIIYLTFLTVGIIFITLGFISLIIVRYKWKTKTL